MSETTATPAAVPADFLRRTVFLRLEFRRLGGSRKADLSKVETAAEKARLALSKRLYDGAEFDAIGTLDGEIRQYVSARTVPAEVGFRGVYVLPVSLIADVDSALTEFARQRAELVAAFVATIELERELARTRLADQFRESDYPAPSEAAAAFGLRWGFVSWTVPEGLPAELREREAAKLAESLAATGEEIRAGLREAFAGLVEHLAESLTPKPDGTRRKFYDSSVGNLREFLELFAARDVTGDAELSALADRARQLVAGATPDQLRTDDGARQRIREGATAIKAAVSGLISGGRRFNLDE